MLTLDEAKKIQKSRERKTLIISFSSFTLIALITFVLYEFTGIFELSSVFWLIPIILVALTLKKTSLLLFLTPRVFEGKVVRMDVYAVKTGTIKGDDIYEVQQGEAFEAELFVENGNKMRTVRLPSGPMTANISVGTKVALLRFVEQPIIEKNS